jgi:hypothetical protein
MQRFAALMVLGVALSSGGGPIATAQAADDVVARRIQPLYAAFTGRELSGAEVEQLATEFASLRKGKSREAIRDDAAAFVNATILLREARDTPSAHSARDELVTATYFADPQRKTLSLRLLTNEDPPYCVDVRSRRVMTRKDVEALANLRAFGKSKEPPRHRPLADNELERLRRALADAVDPNAGNLPQFFAEASTFWAGVLQLWPYLSANEQQLVRSYAVNTWRVHLPVDLYGRLWGLDPQAAQRRWTADVVSRIRGNGDLANTRNELSATLDAVAW